MGVLVLVLAYLALASDPCNAPAEHDLLSECRRLETPVAAAPLPLEAYARHEFGVLQVHRLHPVVVPVPGAVLSPSPVVVWEEVGGSVCIVLGNCGGPSDASR